jgi:hypothetical protein
VKRSETRVFISGAGQSPDFASLHPDYLLRSFAYGIGPSYDRGTFGPGGDMRQTYEWFERMK